jgi:hypothetical protein
MPVRPHRGPLYLTREKAFSDDEFRKAFVKLRKGIKGYLLKDEF